MALWDTAACMELDRFLDSLGIRHSAPTLGSTLGSPPGGHGHTAGSNHYPEWWGGPRGSTGQARDYGDKGSDCEAIARAFEPFAKGPNYVISELIWTRSKLPLSRNGIYYKRGVAYTPSFSLARQHNDHDHVAIRVGAHLPHVGGVVLPPIFPPHTTGDAEMNQAELELLQNTFNQASNAARDSAAAIAAAKAADKSAQTIRADLLNLVKLLDSEGVIDLDDDGQPG